MSWHLEFHKLQFVVNLHPNDTIIWSCFLPESQIELAELKEIA